MIDIDERYFHTATLLRFISTLNFREHSGQVAVLVSK